MNNQETIDTIKYSIQNGVSGVLSNIFISRKGPGITPDMIIDTNTNQTILHLACERNFFVIVKEAFEIFQREYSDLFYSSDKSEYHRKINDWVNLLTFNGNTALKYAFAHDNISIIELLDVNGADFNQYEYNLFHNCIDKDCIKLFVYYKDRIS